MTQRLTAEQVLALAPDPASAQAGSGLATARKWSNTGRDGGVVWGECQGSGKKPYQTRADVTAEPAFKCTCPSRKFPCKHSLGLLLLLAADEKPFKKSTRPAWVTEWVESREERAEKKTAKHEKAADAEKKVDPEARAKRVAARAEKISAGMEELDLWLRDLVRGGIADAASRGHEFWDTMAARLVDAQAPGAARLVGQLGSLPMTGDGWQARMTTQLGRLHLLCTAWTRIDTLPPESQADLRTQIGWTVTEAELSDVAGVTDDWTVIGQLVEDDDRLRMRRTWVYGANSGDVALLLHFAHAQVPFAELLPVVGGTLRAELVFFPGSSRRRAFIRLRDEAASVSPKLPAGEKRLDAASVAFARALARDPWTERVPVVLSDVVPEFTGKAWLVRDGEGHALPIAHRFQLGWTLLAVSGAHPVWLSGEWTGRDLLPLAVSRNDVLIPLSS